MSLAFYSFCQKSEFSMNENPVVHLSMIEYVSINLVTRELCPGSAIV